MNTRTARRTYNGMREVYEEFQELLEEVLARRLSAEEEVAFVEARDRLDSAFMWVQHGCGVEEYGDLEEDG